MKYDLIIIDEAAFIPFIGRALRPLWPVRPLNWWGRLRAWACRRRRCSFVDGFDFAGQQRMVQAFVTGRSYVVLKAPRVGATSVLLQWAMVMCLRPKSKVLFVGQDAIQRFRVEFQCCSLFQWADSVVRFANGSTIQISEKIVEVMPLDLCRNGQLIVCSTRKSEQSGSFYNIAKAPERFGMDRVFVSVHDAPRPDGWFESQKKMSLPARARIEYPATAEEALS